MKNYEVHFTAGQFAKLHHINKRTLLYYDDIGLFSPAFKGENGYRYYTYLQSDTLEMLLTMRELNMSINEIDSYMKHRSASALHTLIHDKTAEIDASIKRLREIRRLLSSKEAMLCLCEQDNTDRIELIECPKEYLLLSKGISGAYDDEDFAVFAEHAKANIGCRLFNASYGSMISSDNITHRLYDNYACFFTKINKPLQKTALYHKPAGTYIRALCHGSWDKLPDTYEKLLRYAHDNSLILEGFCYEEGINEMSITDMDDYVTQITVLCHAR